MFRDKPYTKCFDCVQGRKLKCKHCISLLINRIITDKEHKTETRLRSKQQRMAKTAASNFRHPHPSQQWEVSTRYAMWMNRLTTKENH